MASFSLERYCQNLRDENIDKQTIEDFCEFIFKEFPDRIERNTGRPGYTVSGIDELFIKFHKKQKKNKKA